MLGQKFELKFVFLLLADWSTTRRSKKLLIHLHKACSHDILSRKNLRQASVNLIYYFDMSRLEFHWCLCFSLNRLVWLKVEFRYRLLF